MLSLYTSQIIKNEVGVSTYERGSVYYKQNRVKSVKFQNDILKAIVQGARQYNVTIYFDEDNALIANCSCPVGYNCKHAVAAFLQADYEGLFKMDVLQEKLKEEKLPYQIQDWLNALEKEQEPSKIEDESFWINYIIKKSYGSSIEFAFTKQRILKNGKISADQKIGARNLEKVIYDKSIKKEDIEIIKDLYPYVNSLSYSSNTLDSNLVEKILKTGRCYYSNYSFESNILMKLANPRFGKFEWVLNDDGSQKLKLSLDKEYNDLYEFDKYWFVDHKNAEMGIINFQEPHHLISKLLHAPKIPVENVNALRSKMQHLTNTILKIEAPKEIIVEKLAPIDPIPYFELTTKKARNSFNQIIEFMCGQLKFYYNGQLIDYNDGNNELKSIKNNKMLLMSRNLLFEENVKNILLSIHLKEFKDIKQIARLPDNAHHLFTFEGKNPQRFWLEFQKTAIPDLKELGWKVTIDKDFPFQPIIHDNQFYSNIENADGNHWFDVELGVDVDGQKFNLMPIIVAALKDNPLIFEQFDENCQDDNVIIRSKEKNKYFTFQWEKVKHIFLFLKDLYDTHALNKKGSLKLSYYEAPYLAEIANAQNALDLRWFGDKKIAELGKKLRSFTGINASILPDNFKASLRPYQKEGVDWLQFLRAHQLSGILADDMGLGKTVQTLAHLSIEKKEGRLTKPALVIAPTSLMVNWEAEAQRFTPDLKILVLHGATRKNHYDKIAESDIVFTTYSLLSRDKEKLLHHYFHSIILDEAHRIKNNKTQTTQIVYQLKADHRFCLTGTPLENHLGELWSIYHFLSPGFLGNEKQFKDQYRNPIERDKDENRRKLLIRRIKPFLLRRTKEKVIHELPPKTEIIQRCVLEKDQRDLYETIRVAMDQKVQAEIAQKGLARSHITILDALLKLRQVCCDPRLLKLEHAKKVKHSAKLELLMEMLPEMIEEGRKILLFSQFTSMLDLIKEALHKENIPYVTLTGSTLDRKTPVDAFQAGEVPLFLISLKAGGVGLNLTAADTVIHYDPWWNPAVESQATDRAHRIGQQKAVFVYKFIVSDTVEEKILHMQNHKRALASALFDEDGQAAHKLSADDIKALFEKI